MRTAPVVLTAAFIASVAAHDVFERDAEQTELLMREAEANKFNWQAFMNKAGGRMGRGSGRGDSSASQVENRRKRSVDLDNDELFELLSREAHGAGRKRGRGRPGGAGGQPSGGDGSGEKTQKRGLDLDDDELFELLSREAHGAGGKRGRGRPGGAGGQPSGGDGSGEKTRKRDLAEIEYLEHLLAIRDLE